MTRFGSEEWRRLRELRERHFTAAERLDETFRRFHENHAKRGALAEAEEEERRAYEAWRSLRARFQPEPIGLDPKAPFGSHDRR